MDFDLTVGILGGVGSQAKQMDHTGLVKTLAYGDAFVTVRSHLSFE